MKEGKKNRDDRVGFGKLMLWQSRGVFSSITVLTGAGTVSGSMLSGLAILQCGDYNEWKGTHRMDGTLTAVFGLASKIGQAVGAGIPGVLLDVAGYTGELETRCRVPPLR